MDERSSTGSGWHIKRLADGSGWEGGPYTWDELFMLVRENRLAPTDVVWHPTLPTWAEAHTVPGLFGAPVPQAPVAPAPTPAAPAPAAPAPTSPPAPAPAAPSVPVPAAPAPARKKRGLLIAGIVAAAALVIGGGVAAFLLLGGDGGFAGSGPTLGAADTKLPDAKALVVTETWGEVPSNQLAVVMVEGAERSDAEKVAGALGGTVVGEVEYVGLYQIEFPGTSEADLVSAIQTAEADENVDYAYPNDQVHLDAEIWGVRIDPYTDPFYGGGAGDGYKAIGASKAWAYIKGAGIDLSDVKVGICDDGLYAPGEGAENEFEGADGPTIEYPDPEAGERQDAQIYKDGSTNEAGSHGTAVASIIGADPENGGPAGIAGPLGKKLTISMMNIFSAKYGDTLTTADPDDITKQDWSPGHTYSIGSLVALVKQVEAGATVINCSWGNSNADPRDVATYTRFFTQMAKDHPDVLFVCSGGNGGAEMDGSKRYPSGLKLPNMITVGALDNDGKQAEYADWASEDYEITLGAPGTDAVVGMAGAGGPVRQDGSSFSAPHVTAAAAILKSLNPELNAGQIKEILVATARPGVPTTSDDPTATSQLVPPEMGAGILALDEAVLKVINDLRAEKKLAPFDADALEKLGVVDAVAVTGAAGEYQVRGIVGAVGEKGATLKIEVTGENYSIGGKTEQSLDGAGEAEWSVTLPEDRGTIKVTRLDTGAASLIVLEDFDISGHWDGTFTFQLLDVDPDLADEEGCTLAILSELVGKPIPMTMDLNVGDDGNGSGTMLIDIGSLLDEAESEPADVTVSKSGSDVTFGLGDGAEMHATVTRSGDTLTMTGTLNMGGEGYTVAGSFSVSKPAPER